MSQRTYLGDGLYVEDDGYQFTLIAPRASEEHHVCLESDVLTAFLEFVAKNRNLSIKITKADV